MHENDRKMKVFRFENTTVVFKILLADEFFKLIFNLLIFLLYKTIY